ncbi:hypothetical protein HDU96_006221 [Phlyctochytrium bullatum]|nr:hypothetical protein HDU96_006221 [Phlyctochytrium bullatum]
MAAASEIVVRAPGKVILFGEHAVVYGKAAVAASLGLHTYARIAAHPKDGDGLAAHRFVFPDVDVDVEVQLAELEAMRTDAVDGELKLADERREAMEAMLGHVKSDAARKAVVAAMHLTSMALKGTPIKLEIVSSIPVGSGLGSSASFAVCLAAAVLSYAGKVALEPKQHLAKAEKDTINSWAFTAEQVIHGTPSGIDNAICTYGGAGVYTKGNPLKPIDGLTSLEFMLINTKVPKDTRVQVGKVRERMTKFPEVMEPIMQSIHNISEKCIGMFREKGKTARQTTDRLKELIEVNHNLLNACDVGHPKIEEVRRVLSSKGLASKLTGAGGGGCILSFLDSSVSSLEISKVVTVLEGSGFACYKTKIACPGVQAARVPEKVTIPSLSAEFVDHLFPDIPEQAENGHAEEPEEDERASKKRKQEHK